MSFELLASIAAPALGSLLGGKSADKALDAQQAAGQQSIDLQNKRYDEALKYTSPYRKIGNKANSRLGFLLGLTGGGNPAIGKASNAFKSAEAEYNALASGGSGPSNWIPDDFTRNMDVAGHWAAPGEQGGQGYGGDTQSLDAARNRMEQARNALSEARGQDWETPEGYGSLTDKYTGQDLYDDPSYQFRLDESRKGMENSAAARGMQLSGANLKALDRYTQDYASNEFGAARNRFVGDQDQTYNYLSGQQGVGLQATGMQIGAGQNNANQVGATYEGLGNAGAASSIAKGNAYTSGINSAYNSYQDSQSQQRLNAILRGNGGGYGSNLSSGRGRN